MIRAEAEAWLAHAEGKNDEASAEMRKIAEQEDAMGAEQTSMPAREMLADMMMEMKQPKAALAEYQLALKFNPNRFDGLYGAAQAAEASGESTQANSYYAQLLKSCEGSASTRPELSHAKDLLARK